MFPTTCSRKYQLRLGLGLYSPRNYKLHKLLRKGQNARETLCSVLDQICDLQSVDNLTIHGEKLGEYVVEELLNSKALIAGWRALHEEVKLPEAGNSIKDSLIMKLSDCWDIHI
ncbi:unnamed protein product [Owenia fusiformis]|uniref:Uncharacterized protein n=1 Tax=Owenia fusiformis TaxID=6347 RepID=A0A8S4PJM3_OWEFU|nr:unnamed protein product [Owenia fusiformis]